MKLNNAKVNKANGSIVMIYSDNMIITLKSH